MWICVSCWIKHRHDNKSLFFWLQRQSLAPTSTNHTRLLASVSVCKHEFLFIFFFDQLLNLLFSYHCFPSPYSHSHTHRQTPAYIICVHTFTHIDLYLCTLYLCTLTPLFLFSLSQPAPCGLISQNLLLNNKPAFTDTSPFKRMWCELMNLEKTGFMKYDEIHTL